ncbi:DUF465 domain-containing protein [Magnetofaba australis]|uniref:DUF465 domain-containing protein n=1 Tax=Magnetofaba australis IT-1 TaxID=1434232 RepID=A0A1Y2K8V4_9PROT|nr:DUF465 domain-containing protein [Magnetofaba australis]OSM05225.1 hypothetical protein MAIT1_03388 [Magnetofaba australis IT-1]
MFEDQLQAVQELLTTNEAFKELYDRHQDLKNQVSDLNGSTVDDFTLERLKKEKLLLKDQMATILNQHTGV